MRIMIGTYCETKPVTKCEWCGAPVKSDPGMYFMAYECQSPDCGHEWVEKFEMVENENRNVH